MHDNAPLYELLAFTGGPVATLDAHETYRRVDRVPCYIAELNGVERRRLLRALACDHQAFIVRRHIMVPGSSRHIGSHLAAAFWSLVLPWPDWGEDEGLQALKTLRINSNLLYNQGRKFWRLIAELDRACLRFPATEASDMEFVRFADAGTNTAASLHHERLYRLFGRIYVPGLNSEHAFYADEKFLAFCAVTFARLNRWASQLGDPAEPLTCSPFNNRRIIDHYWLADQEANYRRWEDAFGDLRWIEFLPPQDADRFAPKLKAHLMTATASKPSRAWLAKTAALIADDPDAARDALLALFATWGTADEVHESERRWHAGADAYAHMHLLYRTKKMPSATDDITITDLVNLPWIELDGRHWMPSTTAVNPLWSSEANALLMKGAMWIAPLWPDDHQLRDAVATAITAAATPMTTSLGPKLRALAVATAGIGALKADSAHILLKRLSQSIIDPRVRTTIAKALAELG